MSDRLVRLAGRGLRADGAVVTWTIADGQRGRRWRESVVQDGHLVHSLLYETGTDRRFTHLELATPLGLVTLHPEADATLHGNIVRFDGIEHVVGLPFEPGDALLVAGSPLAAAAVAWAGDHAGRFGRGAILVLDPDAMNVPVAADASGAVPAADPAGIPRLADERIWALQR